MGDIQSRHVGRIQVPEIEVAEDDQAVEEQQDEDEDEDSGIMAERQCQETPLGRALKSEDFQFAENLLKQKGTLPTQNDLQLASVVCGRKSAILKNTCEIVSAHIRRNCSLIRHIWAAYPFQKDEVVFVALTETSDKISIGLPYTILFRKIDDYSPEGAKITYSKESLEKPFTKEESIHLTDALQRHSKDLMDKHSNIQMISACSVKSQNFGTFGARIIPETCIVIYVDVKGLIPISDDPLPQYVDNFTVDVREGGPRLLNDKKPAEYHENLRMGCQIASDTNVGTLGAFLECPVSGELCCLTCAHVFMQKGVNPIGQNVVGCFGPDDRKVYQPTPITFNQIGHVKKAVFRSGGNGQTGVDAALIALTKDSRFPRTGEFPRANTEHAGFTVRKPMLFTSGEMYTRENLPDQFESRSELLKFGCASGPTRGSFHLNGTSVRRREIEGAVMNFGFQLHNQFEVLSIGPSPTDAFAEPGDSGSLVFIPHQGNCSDLRAVGILEGGTFNNTYLVTPIWDVLEALGVSHRLKPFPDHEDQDLPLSSSIANMSIQSFIDRSVSHQSSLDRSTFEENFESLAMEIREEEKKSQDKVQELSAQIGVTNVHFNSEVRELHRRVDNLKVEINQKIDQTEASNQRRHDEILSLLNHFLQTQRT